MSSLPSRAKAAFLAALTPPPPDRHQPGDASPGSPVTSVPVPDDGAPLAPGALFAGRYRMVASLGRGVVGEVWHADDLVVGTPVALKVIDLTIAESRARILEEVRLARRITHPAVCRVFDVGETEHRVFYSMELVDGEDAATLLRHAGHLPAEKVADIGRQLCDGLAAAHAQGALHRALKPANILIDDNGLVRITDFGIVAPDAAAEPDASAAGSEVSGARATDAWRARVGENGPVRARPHPLRAAGWPAAVSRVAGPPRAGPPERAGPGCGPGARTGDHGRAVRRSGTPARVGGRHGGAADGRRGAAPDRSSPLAMDRRRRDRRRGRRPCCDLAAVVAAARTAVDRSGSSRRRRLPEHDRRDGLRRLAQGGAGGCAGAVPLPESVPGCAGARDAAPDAARRRTPASPGRSRGRSRSANS